MTQSDTASAGRTTILDQVVKFDECEMAEPTLRKMILGYYIQGLTTDIDLAKQYADRFIAALQQGCGK